MSSDWDRQTYNEYLHDAERLNLHREMAILRNLQDIEIKIIGEKPPRVEEKGDIPLYLAWLKNRERALKSLKDITQAYSKLVSTEHKKQISSNLTVKIDMNFISQFMQIILSEVTDLNVRKRISARLESFASQRQLTAPDDPLLIVQESLPRLSSLEENIIPAKPRGRPKKKYKMMDVD